MESSAGNHLESRNLPVTELDALTKDVWIAKGGTVLVLCYGWTRLFAFYLYLFFLKCLSVYCK